VAKGLHALRKLLLAVVPADAADALAVALTDYHLRLRPLFFGTGVVRIRSSRA